MPDTGNTGDTGYTGDTGDTSVCGEKYDEYQQAMATYEAAKAAYQRAQRAVNEAAAKLEAAWKEVIEKKAAVKELETECELIGEQIETKEIRKAEIDALDPDSRLDAITPILTGEQHVADASEYWLEAAYLQRLLDERAALIEELDRLRVDKEACPGKIDSAKGALETAKSDRTDKYAEWSRLDAELVEPDNAVKTAYDRAISATNRYYDQGCEAELGYVDYPEPFAVPETGGDLN